MSKRQGEPVPEQLPPGRAATPRPRTRDGHLAETQSQSQSETLSLGPAWAKACGPRRWAQRQGLDVMLVTWNLWGLGGPLSEIPACEKADVQRESWHFGSFVVLVA